MHGLLLRPTIWPCCWVYYYLHIHDASQELLVSSCPFRRAYVIKHSSQSISERLCTRAESWSKPGKITACAIQRPWHVVTGTLCSLSSFDVWPGNLGELWNIMKHMHCLLTYHNWSDTACCKLRFSATYPRIFLFRDGCSLHRNIFSSTCFMVTGMQV
jgi:hypothetical protein